MSKKLELIGNYIVITDTVDNTTVEFPTNRVRYKDSGNNIKFVSADNASQDVSFVKSDFVDSLGATFTDEALLTFLRSNTGFSQASVSEASIDNIRGAIQGYYGLLTDFYFDGNATETTIPVEGIDTWTDVLIDVNANGTFDYRPTAMRDAQSIGHEGDGTLSNPIKFTLEGLDIRTFANFRASMSFIPEDDEAQLESRLLFERHSGTTPSTDFSIEEVSLSMFSGADVDYVSEPMLSFFVGDTIDTNGVGDAGKCRFQIKTNVAGVLKLRALTWYINK